MITFSKISKIIAASLFILASGAVLLYYYFLNPSVQTGLFLKCTFHSFTGLHCPGCGAQRSLHSLLHLDFVNALKNNALLIISLPFILAYIFALFKSWVTDKPFTSYLFSDKAGKWIFWLILGFFILRNIPFFPFEYLSPD